MEKYKPFRIVKIQNTINACEVAEQQEQSFIYGVSAKMVETLWEIFWQFFYKGKYNLIM